MKDYTEFTKSLIDTLTQKKETERLKHLNHLNEWTEPFKQILKGTSPGFGWSYEGNSILLNKRLIKVIEENGVYRVTFAGQLKGMTEAKRFPLIPFLTFKPLKSTKYELTLEEAMECVAELMILGKSEKFV